MSDVVVTVPQRLWSEWLEEGDLPGEPWSGNEYDFYLGGRYLPRIYPGQRVYIVAHGRLRGYSPLVRIDRLDPRHFSLVRRGRAVAVTIDKPIRGFQGWRYRFWEESVERPYDFTLGLETAA